METSNVKRILLVEDDDRDAELSISALEEHNLANRVDRVQNGLEAMEYLHAKNDFANRVSGNPAVVMLDIKMPIMDGHETLKAIREDDKLKYIPVVMLTSSREDSDLLNSYKTGVNAYVVKPVNFERFISSVKDIGVFWAIYNEPLG